MCVCVCVRDIFFSSLHFFFVFIFTFSHFVSFFFSSFFSVLIFARIEISTSLCLVVDSSSNLFMHNKQAHVIFTLFSILVFFVAPHSIRFTTLEHPLEMIRTESAHRLMV